MPYQHAEAFCLMKYTSDDGTEEEIIWNSRDGVTPFVITLRSGKTAMHRDWGADQCVPDYKPLPGSRMFVDLTEERAREIGAERGAYYRDNNVAGACDQFQEEMIRIITDAILAEVRLGAPDLIEVTDGTVPTGR